MLQLLRCWWPSSMKGLAIALNTLSTALMVRLNKAYRNLMVDLHATNVKLIERTIRLTMHATGADADTARTALEQCQHQVKVAIIMLLKKQTADQAQSLLDQTNGNVRAALSA